jgi:hypothetical protein
MAFYAQPSFLAPPASVAFSKRKNLVLPGTAERKQRRNVCAHSRMPRNKPNGSNFIDLQKTANDFRNISRKSSILLVFVNGHKLANLNAPGATRGGISVPLD